MLDQTLWHLDERAYVIVTGEFHPIFGEIPTAGCIPLPDTKTGTFSTDNTGSTGGRTVRGTDTLFTTELYQGDFIYNNGRVRKIKYIHSDTLLELEYKFPASLTDQVVAIPKRNTYRAIRAESIDIGQAVGNNAYLQEAPFPPGARTIDGGSPLAYNTLGYGKIRFSINQ